MEQWLKLWVPEGYFGLHIRSVVAMKSGVLQVPKRICPVDVNTRTEHVEAGCLYSLSFQGRKVKDVDSERKVMHFCRDGRTGTHEGQVDGPVARGPKLARLVIEVIAVSFEDIMVVDDLAQLAGKAEEA